jgi:hypothetical protein
MAEKLKLGIVVEDMDHKETYLEIEVKKGQAYDWYPGFGTIVKHVRVTR